MTKDADAVLKAQAARERSASVVERRELFDHEAHIARAMHDAFGIFGVHKESRRPSSLGRRDIPEHPAVWETHRLCVVRRIDCRYYSTVNSAPLRYWLAQLEEE